MYLKKIEVQGFKSFANKLVFEFDNGITGIVGPNGSGKSNIADAVRWVLGEQSAKQLRGSSMTDVIFAGTQARKPVSFACVSLTIDNSDHKLDIAYDEVTVTRRVFRSGESEYLLNGNSCRLKDINELFYDTGIGKEGYSIIGQGQIDKILSGKPDERRELFDEAAGIVKYKKRKATSQKSLENESANLVRINDILSELEKQVGPLARQSEKAKTYLSYKENLKKYEINLFLLESDDIKSRIKDFSDKLEIVNAQITDVTAEFEQIKSAYDEKEQKIEEINSRIESLTQTLNQAEINKNTLLGHIEILKEQINSANSNDEHISSRLNEINEQIEERSDEKKKLLETKFSIGSEQDEAFSVKNEAESRAADLTKKIEELEADVAQKKEFIMNGLNEKGLVRTNIQRYTTILEQNNIRKAELTSRLINFKTDESAADSILSDLKTGLDQSDKSIHELTSKKAGVEALISENQTEAEQLKSRLLSATEQKMRAASRLETLKNIAERYDGYGNSIRKVMECKNREQGILGVVADLIKTEKKYETAIETALGGAIQNIVTDNEDTAKKMIAYLKSNKYGRATFLPLSALKRKTPSNPVKNEPGFIGYADELVSTDNTFSVLASHLLGRCLVVDTIDNALKLNKKYSYSLKIVTLEGELLNPGGSMTGGAFKNTGNLLGRRREILDLEEILAKTEKAVESINARLSEIESSSTKLQSELIQLSTDLQNERLKQNTIRLQHEQQESKHNELLSLYKDNKREVTEIEKQSEELDANIRGLNESLRTIERQSNEATDQIQSFTLQIDELKKELARQNEVVQTARITYSQIEQKALFSEESLKRVLREIERLKESAAELSESKSDSTAEISSKNNEIHETELTIEKAGEMIASYVQQINELRGQKDELTASVKTFFDSREKCQQQKADLEKEQFRLTQQKEKAESEKDSRIEYMWDEYEITLSQADSLKDESLCDIPLIKKEVASLKSDIRKLGDVNVNSIEEYKEVFERYTLLKTQHDDLVISKEKLLAIIEDLDKEMRVTFTQKFEEIKVEFDKVFRQLFGGGKGTIVLEEDVDILDAGITIISQPPGKKLSNMMQLSGGEKALTAICLLFAIQNLKPSPFCLLDEIEAALDDSNVDRYAKYLHNLTKNTQFIVITHRRGTMACADRLYGITMQEKGVSTLVSVDLIEKQLDDEPKEQK